MAQDEFSNFVSSLGKYFIPSEETTAGAIDIIRTSIKEYVEFRNLQSLVVKLHGNLPSTVVAALCQEKYTGVPLIGIIIAGDRRPTAGEAAEKYCTAWHKLQLSRDIKDMMTYVLGDVEFSFIKYIDPSIETKKDQPSGLISSILDNIARKTNGIMLGNRTWTDTYATFSVNLHNKQTYYPLQFINRGFELPEIAKQLQIPNSIIESSDGEELTYGGTYAEIDVIVNNQLGNLDANLSTQFERFKFSDKVQTITLRFNLNIGLKNDSLSRFVLGLSTNYKY